MVLRRGLFVVLAVLMGFAGGATAASPRPNIVLIITDQQFADAMSCRMGDRYIHTPAMDALATGGAVFSRAYSENPLCMPSRAAMFSGQYSHTNGVDYNGHQQVDAKKYPCLGTRFHDAGYDTAYFGKWHMGYPMWRSGTHSKLRNGFEISHITIDDDETLAHAAGYVRQSHGKPFFMVASFLNPHNVCEFSRGDFDPWRRIGPGVPKDQWPPAPANLHPPRNETDSMSLMRKAYDAELKYFPVGDFNAEDWRHLRWGYYRLIEWIDHRIGRLVATLHERGLDDNTVIVFTSDHGEAAGAHRWVQKTAFYDECVRVPFIVRYPGHVPPGVCEKLVNTGVDLAPTLLDFAGIPIPANLPGRSVKPLALGCEAASWRRFIVAENHMMQAGKINGYTPSLRGRMVRSDRFKYCVYNRGMRRESLFDLTADPGETVNLAGDPEYHDALLQHRGMLLSFAQEHHDTEAQRMLADGVKPIPLTPRSAE